MAMALLEIPVSGWTCLRTNTTTLSTRVITFDVDHPMLTLVDVGRVRLLSDLLALLLFAVSGPSSSSSLL